MNLRPDNMSPASGSGRGCRPAVAGAVSLMLGTLLLVACGGGGQEQQPAAADRLVGSWEAQFTSREAHPPFVLHVRTDGDGMQAVIERSGEKISAGSVERRDLVVTVRVPERDLEIFAKMAPNGGSMSGFWRAGSGGSLAELPFKAWRRDSGSG